MQIKILEIGFVKELRAPVKGHVFNRNCFPLNDFMCCLCLHFYFHALVCIFLNNSSGVNEKWLFLFSFFLNNVVLALLSPSDMQAADK